MKNQILYFVACLVFGIFSSCKSKNISKNSIDDFVKQLEVEIGEEGFHKSLFGDTITFEISDKVAQVVQEKVIIENWNKVEMLFRNTDYVINPYDINSNKIAVSDGGMNRYFILKNYMFIYIIGLNKKGKISLVQEVKIELPPNAPH